MVAWIDTGIEATPQLHAGPLSSKEVKAFHRLPQASIARNTSVLEL